MTCLRIRKEKFVTEKKSLHLINFSPVKTQSSMMVSVGEAFQSVLVDLDIECDNTLPMHIAISLGETQYAKHQRDHMHLIDRKNKKKKNLINLFIFLVLCGRLKGAEKKFGTILSRELK